MASCWNWSEVGHVLVELGHRVSWFDWVGYWSQQLVRDSWGLAIYELSY
jgi:hypothetical protein